LLESAFPGSINPEASEKAVAGTLCANSGPGPISISKTPIFVGKKILSGAHLRHHPLKRLSGATKVLCMSHLQKECAADLRRDFHCREMKTRVLIERGE